MATDTQRVTIDGSGVFGVESTFEAFYSISDGEITVSGEITSDNRGRALPNTKIRFRFKRFNDILEAAREAVRANLPDGVPDLATLEAAAKFSDPSVFNNTYSPAPSSQISEDVSFAPLAPNDPIYAGANRSYDLLTVPAVTNGITDAIEEELKQIYENSPAPQVEIAFEQDPTFGSTTEIATASFRLSPQDVVDAFVTTTSEGVPKADPPEPPTPEVPDFALDAVNLNNLVGAPFSIQLVAENVGDADGAATFAFPDWLVPYGSADDTYENIGPGDTGDVVLVPTDGVSLQEIPGRTFSVGIVDGETQEVTVAKDEVDLPDIQDPPTTEELPAFEFLPLPEDPTFPSDDIISVDIPVGNVGDAPGDLTLSPPGGVSDTTKLIDPGQTATFSFDLPAEGIAGREVEFAASAADAGASVPDPLGVDLPTVDDGPDIGDGDEGGDIELPDDGDKLRVTQIRVPSTVTVGEGYTAEIDVQNTSDTDVKFSVTTEEDGRVREFTAAPGNVATYSQDFAWDEPQTVTHTWVVKNLGTENELTAPSTVAVRSLAQPAPSQGSLGTASFSNGNAFAYSRFILRAESAQVSSGSVTVSGVVENEPLNGPFYSDIVVELEVDGKTTRTTVNPGGGSASPFELSIDSIGPGELRMWQGGKYRKDDPEWQETFEGPVSISFDTPELPPPRFIVENIKLPGVTELGEEIKAVLDIKNTGKDGDVTVSASGYEETKTVGTLETATFEDAFSPSEGGLLNRTYEVSNGTTGETQSFSRTVDVSAPQFLLQRIIAPLPLPLGENFEVGAVVANIGDAAGEAVVSVLGSDTTVTVPAGGTKSVVKKTALSEPTRDIEITVTDAVRGETVTTEQVTVKAARPLFDIVDISVPKSVPLGNGVPISAEVKNVGGREGEAIVSVADASSAVTVPPGESAVADLTVSPESSGVTSYTATVENATTGETFSVGVPEVKVGESALALAAIEAPEAVPVGEAAPIDVVVENSGGADGDAVVSLGGEDKSVMVPAGDTATASFSPVISESGDSEFDVSLINGETESTIATDSVVVGVGSPEFALGDLPSFSAFPVGEPQTVSIPVENVGNAAGVAVVEIDGETFTTGSIAPGGSDSATYDVLLENATPRAIDIEVRNDTTGKTDASRSIQISPGIPSFSIRSAEFPDTVSPGEVFTGTVRVANDGNAPGRVEVSAGLDSRTVRLEPGEERVITFSVTKQPGDPEQITVSHANLTRGSSPVEKSVPISITDESQSPQEPPQPPRRPPQQPPEDDEFTLGDLFNALPDPLGVFDRFEDT